MTSSLVPAPLAAVIESEEERSAAEMPPSQPRRSTATEIPLFASLLQSLRQSIPERTISFHVFTQKPATRLVGINGWIFREGREVAPDLLLDGITAAGVVLNYKGNRFLLEVF
jgi:general secretion pathway protein B